MNGRKVLFTFAITVLTENDDLAVAHAQEALKCIDAMEDISCAMGCGPGPDGEPEIKEAYFVAPDHPITVTHVEIPE